MTWVLLLLQIAVIVAVSRTVGWLAVRIGQPLVVGEMVAGVLLGPSLLGWVWPAVTEVLFPRSSLALLSVIGQIGLVAFMFLVGLRMEPGHLRHRAGRVAVLAVLATAVPFVGGSAVGWVWFTQTTLDRALGWPSILFVGLAMSVTAFPVLARILESRQMQHTRVGTIAMACAAASDAAAWMVLAVLTSVAGGGRSNVGWRLGALLALGAAMAFVVRPILCRYLVRARSVPARLAAVIAVVAIAAAVTETIGLHAFFGAFLAGAVLGPVVVEVLPRLASTLEPPLTMWLLPVFFAFTGLQTNVTALASSPLLAAITALVIAVAVVSKFAPSVVLASALGMSRRDGLTLGALLNTRGMVELVVLSVGLQAGLLTPDAFSSLVLMAIATTAMAAPILTRLSATAPPGINPAHV